MLRVKELKKKFSLNERDQKTSVEWKSISDVGKKFICELRGMKLKTKSLLEPKGIEEQTVRSSSNLRA